MNCSAVRENLSAFIDNELDEAQSTAIKAHLIRCPDCRRERDELESLGRSIRNIPPLTVPPHFEFEIYARIRDLTGRRRERRRSWWRMVLVPAAALVVGVLIGLYHSPASDNFVGNRPDRVTDTGSPAVFASLSPVVTTDDGIREYTIDHYVPGQLIPRTVSAIPDDEDVDTGDRSAHRSDDGRETTERHAVPNYVLDRIPMQVGYERTIY